jgi:lincosamide nucleotidyltransferase A/C/D/E
MGATDAVAVLDLLESNGVRAWVDGGWGVDALLGRQTREHNDLDLAIDCRDDARYHALMLANGYADRPTDFATPRNYVMVDGEGREVDVHLVDFAATRRDEAGVAIYGPRGLEYEVGALDGIGTIAGRRVRCCTAEFQVRSHTGYEPDADDVRDVMALHERFGIPLPPPYA